MHILEVICRMHAEVPITYLLHNVPTKMENCEQSRYAKKASQICKSTNVTIMQVRFLKMTGII